MRLTSKLHAGMILGIATTSVILALGGCVTSGATGPTVRADSATPSAGPDALSQFSADERTRILAVQDIVDEAAREHAIDPSLINAMIWVESRFDPRAKSSAGARGLMQLMPATAAYLAKRMGENNARAYDPQFNVRAGALYLAQMLETFGDERLAVAAYHAGPGNVKRWVEAKQDFPDYSNTYVAKVMDARGRFEGVELHGRPSSSRPAQAAVAVELDEDGLEVPDVDSLPDAADIHGVARVIYEQPEPKSRPRPEPEPKSRPQPEPMPTPRPSAAPPASAPSHAHEAVFVVHPELDARPTAAPPGWNAAPEQREPPKRQAQPERREPPKRQAQPEPQEPSAPAREPTPEPDAPEQGPETGLGVLPDL